MHFRNAFIVLLLLLGCGSNSSPATNDGGIDAASDAMAARDASGDAATPIADGEIDAALRDGAVVDAASATDAAQDAMRDAMSLEGAHPDIVKIVSVPGRNPGDNWSDSYSVGDKCYCETTFDHNIGDIEVSTPVGTRTVRQVCDAIGPGPGSGGRPLYNDIQCGNGPANDAGDEDDCPGRVDIGREGCGHIGPKWDLSNVQ